MPTTVDEPLIKTTDKCPKCGEAIKTNIRNQNCNDRDCPLKKSK